MSLFLHLKNNICTSNSLPIRVKHRSEYLVPTSVFNLSNTEVRDSSLFETFLESGVSTNTTIQSCGDPHFFKVVIQFWTSSFVLFLYVSKSYKNNHRVYSKKFMSFLIIFLIKFRLFSWKYLTIHSAQKICNKGCPSSDFKEDDEDTDCGSNCSNFGFNITFFDALP